MSYTRTDARHTFECVVETFHQLVHGPRFLQRLAPVPKHYPSLLDADLLAYHGPQRLAVDVYRATRSHTHDSRNVALAVDVAEEVGLLLRLAAHGEKIFQDERVPVTILHVEDKRPAVSHTGEEEFAASVCLARVGEGPLNGFQRGAEYTTNGDVLHTVAAWRDVEGVDIGM